LSLTAARPCAAGPVVARPERATARGVGA
jgi:hypothetical protein